MLLAWVVNKNIIKVRVMLKGKGHLKRIKLMQKLSSFIGILPYNLNSYLFNPLLVNKGLNMSICKLL